MRFLHLSDLHFGKSINECALVEKDQPYWVDGFISLAKKERPDAVVIAGDVYDRSTPSGQAVMLLDKMLTKLMELDIPVMLIAGNHDSGQRLSFASRLLEKQNLHIAGIVEKEVRHVTLQDEFGPVTFWLVPYIFPVLISNLFDDSTINTYEEAMRRLLAEQNIDYSQRNVIVAHQSVTRDSVYGERGGSETMVGGIGGMDYTVFDGFAYVALGHIHAAQYVGRPEVRYAGSPLCYHFNETRQKEKGPLLVELGAIGTTASISTCKIEPLHPMREIRGSFDEIVAAELDNTARNEFLRVVLKGRLTPDLADKLRAIFKSHDSLALEMSGEDNGYTFNAAAAAVSECKTVEEQFVSFYSYCKGGEMPDDGDMALISYILEQNEFVDEEKLDDKELNALVEFACGLEEV